jgi:hypothetical protein
MSVYRCTFLCAKCFALRRRPFGVERADRPPGRDYPHCCGQPMQMLGTKVAAEAASKLTRAERRRWVMSGMHVVRRPGRRWTAALTPRQIAAARDQREGQERRIEALQTMVWDASVGTYVPKPRKRRSK